MKNEYDRLIDAFISDMRAFISDMRGVDAPAQDYYDALRAVIEEVEIELQACKETM